MISFLLLIIDGLLLTGMYKGMYRKRKTIGFHQAKNITMTISTFAALLTGLILVYLFPQSYVGVTIITTIIGLAVGAAFGILFDYQSMLMGYSHGGLMGLMSPMIGGMTGESLVLAFFAHFLFFGYVSFVFIQSRRKAY